MTDNRPTKLQKALEWAEAVASRSEIEQSLSELTFEQHEYLGILASEIGGLENDLAEIKQDARLVNLTSDALTKEQALNYFYQAIGRAEKAEAELVEAKNRELALLDTNSELHEELSEAREMAKREAYLEAGKAMRDGLLKVKLTERETELLSKIAAKYIAFGEAAISPERVSLEAENTALREKYDKLHDQRHQEARAVDRLNAENVRMEAENAELRERVKAQENIIETAATNCVYCGDSEARVQRLEAENLALAEILKKKDEAIKAVLPILNRHLSILFRPEYDSAVHGVEAVKAALDLQPQPDHARKILDVVEAARKWVRENPAKEGECGNSTANEMRRLVSRLDAEQP